MLLSFNFFNGLDLIHGHNNFQATNRYQGENKDFVKSLVLVQRQKQIACKMQHVGFQTYLE